jgi:hypothetical protein
VTIKSFLTFQVHYDNETKFFFSAWVIFSMALSAFLFIPSCQLDEPVHSSAPIANRTPAPDVPAILQVPAGQEVSYHTYATGVQVYVSTETAPGVFNWVFKAPVADLFANAAFNGQVGTHYAGPTWESNSGSKVVAARLQGITVDPDAILVAPGCCVF